MSAIEFLRDVGKHFSVNVMLDRDTIRRRLEGEGISYTEFSYMLLQANDYVELHRRHGCTLQIGGSDQWGNIIAGVRLVRQKLGATVHALTVPLVTAADGTKFGKSTGGGSLWLDPEMTTPVCLVPVLRQHRRRRRDPVPAMVHLLVGRRAGRAGTGDGRAAAATCRPTSTGPRADRAGARRGRPPRRSSTPAGRSSARANWTAWTRRRWRRRCARRRSPSSNPAVPTGSSTCWWPAACPTARRLRGARSAKAACRSTTFASTATNGRRSPRTSCTADGWCCAAASAISPASNGSRTGGRLRPQLRNAVVRKPLSHRVVDVTRRRPLLSQ